MKVTIISVGKAHESIYKEAIETFELRLSKTLPITWCYIPTSKKEIESEGISKAIKEEDYVILLDERGKSIDNKDLSELIDMAQNNSYKRVVCIIGGAYGVSDEIMLRADYILSLSKLVFPHQLVRLILIEQLYRSVSILHNGKYHHE